MNKNNQLKNTVQLFFLIGLLIFIAACEPPVVYPETPQISYKSHTTEISEDKLANPIKLVNLTIYIIDGDGDIGELDDTLKQDSAKQNLFTTLYVKKENDSIFEIKNIEEENYIIPYVNLIGQNKTLKADIKIKIDYPLALFSHDTIKYEIYIKDRAGHESNKIITPEIIFPSVQK